MILIASCSRPNTDPKYGCSSKGDCLASTDTCECVTSAFYNHVENNSCENFGCECVKGICTKTAPVGK